MSSTSKGSPPGEHVPVLLNESIDGLKIKPGGTYIDGTLGRGGHALEILNRLDGGRLIAIDCDAEAVEKAGILFSGHKGKGKITIVRDNFRNIAEIMKAQNIETADGMIFDLGASSPQFDDEKRGFSYMRNAKLDMRMDAANKVTAYEIINTGSCDELARIFYEYGEERYSRQISRAIVRRRDEAPVSTTFDLNEIILSAIPPAARREQQHPSKRCFQALRIAVGDELGALSEMLDAVPGLLKPGGRICVISFHSLEDRIVKRAFAARAGGCTCPRNLPVCVCGHKPELKIITKKPVTAVSSEIEANPRARSARLRIAEKI